MSEVFSSESSKSLQNNSSSSEGSSLSMNGPNKRRISWADDFTLCTPSIMLNIVKAILVRGIFSLHFLLTLSRVVSTKKNPLYWYIAFMLWPILVELSIAIIIRKGKEYKWFCPSVFFYLSAVMPCIWILEMDEVEKYRILQAQEQTKHLLLCPAEEVNAARRGFIAEQKRYSIGISLPITLTHEGWIIALEQSLVIILIIGRWLLPRGELSRDQLSQILLVYIGTAADIMSLFETFEEQEAKGSRLISIVILSIWTWSFAQFTFVLTTLKSRKDKLGAIFFVHKFKKAKHQMFIDLMGVMSNLMFQDIPFLILRILLITKFNIISVMMVFFIMKNILVIVLEMYRVAVLFLSRRKRLNEIKKKALIHSYFKSDPKKLVSSGAVTIPISAIPPSNLSAPSTSSEDTSPGVIDDRTPLLGDGLATQAGQAPPTTVISTVVTLPAKFVPPVTSSETGASVENVPSPTLAFVVTVAAPISTAEASLATTSQQSTPQGITVVTAGNSPLTSAQNISSNPISTPPAIISPVNTIAVSNTSISNSTAPTTSDSISSAPSSEALSPPVSAPAKLETRPSFDETLEAFKKVKEKEAKETTVDDLDRKAILKGEVGKISPIKEELVKVFKLADDVQEIVDIHELNKELEKNIKDKKKEIKAAAAAVAQSTTAPTNVSSSQPASVANSQISASVSSNTTATQSITSPIMTPNVTTK